MGWVREGLIGGWWGVKYEDQGGATYFHWYFLNYFFGFGALKLFAPENKAWIFLHNPPPLISLNVCSLIQGNVSNVNDHNIANQHKVSIFICWGSNKM